MSLVSDIEALRIHFNVETWHVFGGSWGSTLSMIYGITHPERIRSFILRGIFMCRKSELHWFYQEGASHVFPDAFEPYFNHIPKDEQSALIPAYYKRLTSQDVEIRRAAAKEWTRWEMATSRLFPDPEYLDKAEDLDFGQPMSVSSGSITINFKKMGICMMTRSNYIINFFINFMHCICSRNSKFFNP